MLTLLLVGGCAHMAGVEGTSADHSRVLPWEIPPAEHQSQRLIRLRYEGPGATGGLKLILRLEDPSHFQVTASDPLGRSLWSLRFAAESGVLVDHRRRWFCSNLREIHLPGTRQGMPLDRLPHLLLGRLPGVPATDEEAREGERWPDAEGREWSWTLRQGEPATWTLWKGGRPEVWWLKRDRGGILSHREGVQLRWSEVLSEGLPGGLPALEVPTDYARNTCDASNLPQLWQDQPPPAGSG